MSQAAASADQATAWHALSPQDALRQQGVDAERGLSAGEVASRTATYVDPPVTTPPTPAAVDPPAPAPAAVDPPAPAVDPLGTTPRDPSALAPAAVDAAAHALEHLAVGRAPDVRAADPWPEAGRKLLRFHLARTLARVPGVVAGDDIEEVHAMRVAARRMRAAWRVFGDGFEPDARRRYRAELRDLGAQLGAVRDMDVLIEILAARGRKQGARGRAGLEPLAAAWRGEREARRVELLAVLASERFTRFVRDYEAFAETPGLAGIALPPHSPRLVGDRMPATIWRAYGAVRAFDADLAGADLPTLHELRITGKWLRYTLEFVREALEPEATVLIARIVSLQDHLGTQHDLHVAAELARTFATSAGPEGPQARALGTFIGRLDADVERLRRTLPSAWRPIVAPGYRRTLGRAIARL